MPVQQKVTCLACGSPLLSKIYNPEPQPLAALNLPKSAQEAHRATRFPMDFRMCLICGHVFNVDFDCAKIPYAEDSNLMYNSGSKWQTHIDGIVDMLEEYKVFDGTCIDIGCGDGQFFQRVLKRHPDASLIGFEPGVDADKISSFQVIRDYFIPERDLWYNPSLITCRHVLEHMENPRAFLSDLAFWSSSYTANALFFFEVPCINVAIKDCRLSDFLYEHVSNFTCYSFELLFRLSGFQPLKVTTAYNNEVLLGFFKLGNMLQPHKQLSGNFTAGVKFIRSKVYEQMHRLVSEHSVALWGGTGKSAAFINLFELDDETFKLVVDSDKNKIGRFVPGTGQLIQSPDVLLETPVDVIVITTPWRTEDILMDIELRGIEVNKVFVLKQGALHACYTK